jgi:hypothetical protein
MLSWYPKFHVALHASHAALPIVTLKISPCTNVTLNLGWITLFMGDMGEGALQREERNCQIRKLKLVMGHIGGPAPRWTGRQTVYHNITWHWNCVIALKITDPSSHQRGRLTSTNLQLSKNDQREKGKKLVMGSRWVPDTRTDWPTDCRS